MKRKRKKKKNNELYLFKIDIQYMCGSFLKISTEGNVIHRNNIVCFITFSEYVTKVN